MINLTGCFREAFEWAVILHGGQKRKGTEIPYLSHLMAVASSVMEYAKNEKEVIAALLHDAAEDVGGWDTLKNIENRFGKEVAEIVRNCTDSFDRPKPPYKERKEIYIAGLKDKSSSSQLVSLADKVHNASSILNDYLRIGEDLWKRFSGSREEILWYYDKLVKEFKRIDNSEHRPLVEELERIIEKLKDNCSEV